MTSNRLEETAGSWVRGRLGWYQEKVFTQRVVEHWNKLLREMITAPNLSELKKLWDKALRHRVGLLGVPHRARSWIYDPDEFLLTQHILWFYDITQKPMRNIAARSFNHREKLFVHTWDLLTSHSPCTPLCCSLSPAGTRCQPPRNAAVSFYHLCDSLKPHRVSPCP